jgi:hypothetical protein
LNQIFDIIVVFGLVLELADRQALEACDSNIVEVQLLSSPQKSLQRKELDNSILAVLA